MSIFINKPAILDCIGDTHCVIEASAGTGKTYTLEHIVVDLLIKGVPPDKILLVTFTTKATLELKIRIRARLEAIIEAVESNQLIEFPIADAPKWEITNTTRLFLKRAIANFNQITISTIHGFCQQALQDAAFEEGRLFQQKIVFGDDTFNKVFKSLIRTRFTKVDTEKTMFFRAITTIGSIEKIGDLLRAAAKERMHLDLPNIKTLKLMLESFPIMAANAFIQEVQDYQNSRIRVEHTLGPMLGALKNANISGNSYRAISNRLKQVLHGIELYQKTQTASLFWSEVTSAELQYLQDKFNTCIEISNSINKDYITNLAQACTSLMSQAYDFKAFIVATLLPPLVEELTQYKKREGLIDFDDMIVLLHQLINSDRGALFIERLRERFQIALIDEFQDTDSLQWDIFRKLFLTSNKHRLILVGDPKQAIYGFRNGDLPTYLTAINTIQKITGRSVINLTTNFRSTKELISVQYQIFQGNNNIPFFTGKNTGLLKPTTCGKPELSLHDHCGNQLAPLHIVDIKNESQDSLAIQKHTASSIALAIQETIMYSRLNGNPIKPEDVMVLTNSAKEGLEMAYALNAIGIPHTFFKQSGLFSTHEAKCLRDLFLAIDTPLDTSKRAKALLGPFFHFNFNEIEYCRDLPSEHPIIKCLFLWRKLILNKQYEDFFHRLIADSGITQRLLLLNDDKRSLINILHIIELLQQETMNSFYTPLDLAVKMQHWINGTDWPNVEDADVQRLESLTGAVQILTIHKSKGLEALVVAVYGGLSTNNKQSNIHRYHDKHNKRKIWVGSLKYASDKVKHLIEDEIIEDYQRLLYVALTRAKIKLILPRFKPQQATSTNNSECSSTIEKYKWAYECINQQLLTLPDTSFISYVNTNHNAEKKPSKENKPSYKNGNPALQAILNLPKFRELAKAGRPIWKFSYTSINNEINNLQYRSHYQKHVNAINNKNQSMAMDHYMPISGVRLGNVVHKLLQIIPLDSFQNNTIDQWLKNPTIISLLQNDTTTLTYEMVASLIYQAMTTKLELPSGELVIISQLKRTIREMNFVTKYPGHDDLLNGSLDMVFQSHGKTYILDWKTNQLDSYNKDDLAIVMAEQYSLQVKLYSIVICQLLKITSEKKFNEIFGGLIYVFLKGLPANGVWTLKPSWADIQNWELELKNLPIDSFIPINAGGNKVKN